MPNTYTLSKGLAEQLVDYYHNKHRLPACIVRPSMVGATYMEPVPGYIDTFNGFSFTVVEMNRGTIQGSQVGYNLVCDLIPVDICCNIMLASAWFINHKP